MSEDWIEHDGKDCPLDGEQRVQVKWRDLWLAGTTTTHRAGALNWENVQSYRLLPNPTHSQ